MTLLTMSSEIWKAIAPVMRSSLPTGETTHIVGTFRPGTYRSKSVSTTVLTEFVEIAFAYASASLESR